MEFIAQLIDRTITISLGESMVLDQGVVLMDKCGRGSVLLLWISIVLIYKIPIMVSVFRSEKQKSRSHLQPWMVPWHIYDGHLKKKKKTKKRKKKKRDRDQGGNQGQK